MFIAIAAKHLTYAAICGAISAVAFLCKKAKGKFVVATLAASLISGSAMAYDLNVTIQHVPYYPSAHTIQIGPDPEMTLDPWLDRDKIMEIERQKAANRAAYCRDHTCAAEVPLH